MTAELRRIEALLARRRNERLSLEQDIAATRDPRRQSAAKTRINEINKTLTSLQERRLTLLLNL